MGHDVTFACVLPNLMGTSYQLSLRFAHQARDCVQFMPINFNSGRVSAPETWLFPCEQVVWSHRIRIIIIPIRWLDSSSDSPTPIPSSAHCNLVKQNSACCCCSLDWNGDHRVSSPKVSILGEIPIWDLCSLAHLHSKSNCDEKGCIALHALWCLCRQVVEAEA